MCLVLLLFRGQASASTANERHGLLTEYPIISGSAIFVYGTGWSSILSTFQASINAQDLIALFLDSSLPKNSEGRLLSDDFLFVRSNPPGSPRTLNGNDYNGEGQFGPDYTKSVTVTSGSL